MPFGSSANSEPVVFRYPPRLDVFREPIPGTGRDVLVEDCLFAPGAGREIEVNANQVRADGTLFAPPDAPEITAHDQVVIRDEVYDVAEKPRYWMNEGYEIPVRLVTG
jgi:hypothetical protein